MGSKKQKRSKHKKQSKSIVYNSNSDVNFALNAIAEKRVGGAINIQGIGFQLLYACFKILRELDESLPERGIRLEGIEDIDDIRIGDNEYIQLKSSINDIDAGAFWSMGVLQNFFEVFVVNENSKLRLVHNFCISKGKLKQLSESNLPKETIAFWEEKFKKSEIDSTKIDFSQFLNNIHFEKVSNSQLIDNCLKLLIEKFSINTGTDHQYLKALFYNVFQWSKERSIIKYSDLIAALQIVTDSFSKAPINPALRSNWIESVKFDVGSIEQGIGYYEGKSARPIHIAQNLPVRRKEWEVAISRALENFDVTIIKSSSGQGKSTLAWQISQTFQSSGLSIYELNYCQDWENVAGIVDFIETRLKIGELPLIVIDGLNKTVSQYNELIVKTAHLPVKYIITTREEDWYRYGLDASKIRTQIVDISLSINEAKDIYQQLKNNGKIHSSINQWEPIWEKIESRGLLIEFVYLLTRGQMIQERLQQQIKSLNDEKDANVKIEILRIISLADILNLKVKTVNLINHIQSTIGFRTDRGEVLKQLEKEYYVRFDNKYIEGLHPVRSQHLVNILHASLSISESLITLFKIIDEDSVYDYFISVSPLIPANEKQEFYGSLSELVSIRKFSEMVYAIDGLMHSEPYRYWEQNRQIFDDVQEKGGIEVFIGDTLPFTKLNTIESLKKSMGDKFPSLQFLSDKLKELSPYDINNSDVAMFVKCLSTRLDGIQSNINSYEGLGFLVKWFRQLSIPFPLILQLNESQLINILDEDNINESGELFSYFYTLDPKAYNLFVKKHKEKIIAILKKETNSLTIEEIDKDISIEYLLDTDADKANEFSVYRIQTVFSFFPTYDRYRTKAIILPFPNEEMYKIVIQNSTKAMPKENIADTFDVHINQIWNHTILDNYRCASSFEWQEQQLKLRKEAVEFAKICTRYFEAIFEGNISRIKSSLAKLIQQGLDLSNLLKKRKNYPRQSRKYFDKEAVIEEQKSINAWCSSLDNFVNQLGGLIQPKSNNDRNLAYINLKATVYKLSQMQNAFEKVGDSTFRYFHSEELIIDEQIWFDRLLRTVAYYITEYISSPEKKLLVAKSEIENWWKLYHENRLQKVYSIITDFESKSYFTFHLPNRIIEEESLKYVVIGVDRIESENIEDKLLDLIGGLVELATIDIDFFTFVNIYENEAIGAFRVQKDFIQRLKTFIEGGEFEESEYGNPIPVNLEDSILESLEGITIKKLKIEEGNESFTKMMFDIWKLSEYRNRLNSQNNIEKDWLIEIEKEFQVSINNHVKEIETVLETEEFQKIKQSVFDFLKGEIQITNDEIISKLNERLESVNSTLLKTNG